MQRVRLTDTLAAKTTLPPGKSDLVLWDSEVAGFALRVRTTSSSWILAYRPAGAGRTANTKKLQLGSTAALKAADARNLARVALGRVAAGADPQQAKKEKKAEKRVRLNEMLDEYERDLERRQYVSFKLHVRNLRTKMKALLNRDVREITGAELAAIITKLEQAGRPGAAADFRARCRAFFSWLVSKPKVITANPLSGFRKERATRADRVQRAQHGKALTDDEIARLWHATDPATVFGRWIRFLILTGCRRGEGAGLTWAMVDRKAKVIRLPAVFTKQGRGHVVPITPLLGEVLDTCTVDARSDLVFASPRSGGKMLGYTQLNSRLVKEAGVDFHFHDLRRTFRTGLSRLRVDTETSELALGHPRGDLEARYNRDDALEELRKAFGAWSGHVRQSVSEAST